MLIFIFSFIVIFILIISREKNKVLIFLAIILVKIFIPFIDFNENIALSIYSLILLTTIIHYFFISKASYIDKISSFILSLIIFLTIFIGELLIPQNLRFFLIDKYILYGLIISFIVFVLNKADIGGYIGSIWGILLFEYISSYFEFKKLNSKVLLGGENIFSIIISLSAVIAIINFIQVYKNKANDDSVYNGKDENKNDLLKLIIKDK